MNRRGKTDVGVIPFNLIGAYHYAAYNSAERYQGISLGATIALMMDAGMTSVAPKKGVSVIGPRANYREFAKKIGANFLDVTDDAWTMRKNVEFLQGVVRRGDDVMFSGKFNPALLDPNSVLGQEIRYLQRHGYSWADDFSRMIIK